MTKLLDIICQFFHTQNWYFSKIEGESVLRMDVGAKNGEWSCFAQLIEDPNRFVFYSVIPEKIVATKRVSVAEYLTRVNYGLVIGNFEMDFDDGEIRFRTSVDVVNDILEFDLIKSLVYTNIGTVDKYLPGIWQVVENDIAPLTALATIL
ncbi:hypothetical protein AMR41_08695 [Hapalosiphon sp. MRB220]|nr:hypothetical protein AMR41_08695 [Hapalosiphon sp. MRB220]